MKAITLLLFTVIPSSNRKDVDSNIARVHYDNITFLQKKGGLPTMTWEQFKQRRIDARQKRFHK